MVWWRFDAPLMSFGGESIDSHSVTRRYPCGSMLTGLIGNALGWHHRNFSKLQALQSHMEYGARADLPGELLRDYQTVDLGQRFLLDELAWTTHDELDRRAGDNSTGTHIRERDYLADAVYTVVVSVKRGAGVSAQQIGEALEAPARPLFIGRKPCLPSAMRARLIQAEHVREALGAIPLSDRYERLGLKVPSHLEAWWTVERELSEAKVSCRPVSEARDWRNQVHVGQRFIAHGRVALDELKEVKG